MFYNTNLTPDLRVLKDEIEGYARDYGLDFYETIFEVVDADDLNEIAAYGGFPTRYPHWSFGMAYEELKKSYEYGLSKIYEMVINNDPCYAYLMRCNHTVDQKLVMAHVYGHCDFFKNNAYFAHTTRKMMDEIANHGSRVRRYAERFGEDAVEAFIDRCMSIDDLIDIHSVAIHRRDPESRYDFNETPVEEDTATRFKGKDYMADYLNPPEVLRAKEEEARQEKLKKAPLSFPERPEKDVLLFLIEHAPLLPWQRDILSIIRDEAYYFYPQAQTKIINEGWACVVADTLIPTAQGFLRAQDLVEQRQAVHVSDGTTTQAVYDWAAFRDYPTVKISTRRGLVLEGSENHRIMRANGEWCRLDQLHVGDSVHLARGQQLWASNPVALTWTPPQRQTMTSVAHALEVDPKTVWRYANDPPQYPNENIMKAVRAYQANASTVGVLANARRPVRLPKLVDEPFAAFLGYLLGDGHISAVKRALGLTTGDHDQAETFAALVEQLFGITPRIKKDANRYRVLFSSQIVRDFLVHLGLKTGPCAHVKCVPEVILRSPAPVVAAFLRALYDCDGYAGPAGVILSTSSVTMSQQVQQLLLNFGVLSIRRPQQDGCWHVHTMGRSAQTFRDAVGFDLLRKQDRLERYLADHRWFKVEDETDTIVQITHGQADVFDMSVANTHRYVAAGLLNHNSYWHSTIMTQKALHPSELIDYADHHSGTMAMSGGRLNPYKLGIELLRDIEERWNSGRFGPEYDACDDLETKRTWNKDLGLGRKKIFEVRRVHNDITLIDTFLTPEFCMQHKLFSFGYAEQQGQYVIESREFDLIKQRLLFSLTNFGKPWIYVLNGNHRNRGELLLKHEYNGIELKLNHAHDVLVHVQTMWARPVHIETVVDGKPTLLSWDGTDYTQKAIGETDVNRKTLGKT